MDHAFDIRTLVHMGAVLALDDSGEAQTATVKTHDGVIRGGVEVLQQYGFASLPPGDGAIGLLIAVGGDAGQFVMLPASCPATRFGGLVPGEAVVYAADGTRVHVRAGGVIDITGGNLINVNAPSIAVTATGSVTVSAPEVTIDGSAGVTLTAPNVTVNGNLLVVGGSLSVNGTKMTVP